MDAKQYLITQLDPKTDIQNLSPLQVANIMEWYANYYHEHRVKILASEEKAVDENERREKIIDDFRDWCRGISSIHPKRMDSLFETYKNHLKSETE